MDSTVSRLAPCIAVVGPANCGKTTLLHLLDESLQHHPTRPAAYVVPGNPDGTGRYLFHAPELREKLKSRVKGVWQDDTVETVCHWIDNARAALEIVLLDFGGRHAPVNEMMLRRCSHYLVVSRAAADSQSNGAHSWIEVCRRCRLEQFGRFRSLWRQGQPSITTGPGGALEAVFRADTCTPGDSEHREVVRVTVDALLALRRPRRSPPYLSLQLDRDWTPEDVAGLGGLAAALGWQIGSIGEITLGGRAPVWAYAAALQRIVELNSEAVIRIFDPKIPGALIEIPTAPSVASDSALDSSLEARWSPAPGGEATVLALQITTGDRFLTVPRAASLRLLPMPCGRRPRGAVTISGAVPVWLHLCYARWLRSQSWVSAIAAWDARTSSAISVYPVR